MKILLIPDKFKGSLSAQEVAVAVSNGLRRLEKRVVIHKVLASDGGDGFLEAVQRMKKIKEIEIDTVDPLGRKIKAEYLWDSVNKSAYIELAKASGLTLLKFEEQNPMKTSTYGTGLQLKDAIAKGAKFIYVGLGGSATNDVGIGIASALGYNFLDSNKQNLNPCGENLNKIESIFLNKNNSIFEGVRIIAVNDVNNPLYGKNGASFVYAAQKGGNRADIEKLDLGLRHLDKKVKEQLGKEEAVIPGAGAAGGTAYGLKVFLDAEFIGGTEFIFNLCQVDKLLMEHNFGFIITGEGSLDKQTLNGKLIQGVLELGRRFNVPVIAVCGKLGIDKKELNTLGFMDILEISDSSKSLQYSMENAANLVEGAIFNYFGKAVL
ncbi:glycerate kinase [Flavobacteriaceae bacterium F89]|uniref:Glycerate kinase n=1 Tax=Cerina litoralis TaxID=2874477 RepID=A0AAE3EWM7_9FLAO|nr:glycerate kinase [Cerina litoralis]MCG2461066.1 glycerate kinase [Cerina litoralis]